MNREIKFRAWNPVQEAMYPLGKAYSFQEGVLTETATDNEDGEIVMQFTGLKDKNGKEIYEGDLITMDEREYGGKHEPRVMGFIDGSFHAGAWGKSDLENWCEVIGNLYETNFNRTKN